MNKNNQALSFVDWLWVLVFSMAMLDVVISYFAKSMGLSIFLRPWWLITPLFLIALTFSLNTVLQIRSWLLISFIGLIIFLAIGALVIDTPSQYLQIRGLNKVGLLDLISTSAAFIIGAVISIRHKNNGQFISDLFLIICLLHAIVCLIALLKIYPYFFPVIDKPYWKGGIPISRPEITTDQTRQILYLIPALCTIFISSSKTKLILSLFVAVSVLYIIAKVQSRWSIVIFTFFLFLSLYFGFRNKKQSILTLFLVFIAACILVIYKIDAFINIASNLIWRFGELGSSYGGRLIAIQYLFEKLGDVSYWIPQGYAEFFKKYNGAPHSFPTMIYLNGGLMALIFYIILVVSPLFILFKRIIRKTANAMDLIAFYCGSFAFMLLMTQPVITHEIFWLISGVVVGAVSVKASTNNFSSIGKSRTKNRSKSVVCKIP